jgi:hypothetical protein
MCCVVVLAAGCDVVHCSWQCVGRVGYCVVLALAPVFLPYCSLGIPGG